MRESTSSRSAEHSSRRDYDDSAIPNQPTESVAPAYTPDAAERAEVAKSEPAEQAPPSVTPDALGRTDAGIKYGDLQVPGFTTIRKNFVVVRRKRRRPKKPRGPLENLPF